MAISRPIVIATCDWSKCGVKIELEYSNNVVSAMTGDGWVVYDDRHYCCIEHMHEDLKRDGNK